MPVWVGNGSGWSADHKTHRQPDENEPEDYQACAIMDRMQSHIQRSRLKTSRYRVIRPLYAVARRKLSGDEQDYQPCNATWHQW